MRGIGQHSLPVMTTKLVLYIFLDCEQESDASFTNDTDEEFDTIEMEEEED